MACRSPNPVALRFERLDSYVVETDPSKGGKGALRPTQKFQDFCSLEAAWSEVPPQQPETAGTGASRDPGRPLGPELPLPG